MLAHVIEAIAIFFVVRFFASLYIARASISNGVAAGAIVIFALALWAHGAWYRSQNASAGLPVATGPAVEATQPTPIVLPRAEIAHLSAATGSPALAAIDAITLSPGLSDAPPGNVVRPGSRFFVRGWAASADKVPFQGLIVVIDQHVKIDGTAHYGGARPDVSKAYNAPNMTYTGFNGVPVSTAGLHKGPHSLQVGGLSTDRRHYILAPIIVPFTVQ